MKTTAPGLALIALASAAPALASETVAFSYDARGRLVEVAKSGGPNAGITASYSYDRADNRTYKVVTGSTYDHPATRVIMVSTDQLHVVAIE